MAAAAAAPSSIQNEKPEPIRSFTQRTTHAYKR